MADDLANDRVSEAQSLWYAIISSIMYYAAIYVSIWFSGYRSWLLIIEFLVACIIVVIGVQECFKANGGTDGRHFLKRMYCLGVPIGIKTFLLSTAIGHVLQYGFPRIVTTESFRNPYLVFQLLSYFFAGLLAVIYFWWIAYHLKRVADHAGVQSDNP